MDVHTQRHPGRDEGKNRGWVLSRHAQQRGDTRQPRHSTATRGASAPMARPRDTGVGWGGWAGVCVCVYVRGCELRAGSATCNGQAADDADGQVPLGLGHLLRHAAHHVEPQVGKENGAWPTTHRAHQTQTATHWAGSHSEGFDTVQPRGTQGTQPTGDRPRQRALEPWSHGPRPRLTCGAENGRRALRHEAVPAARPVVRVVVEVDLGGAQEHHEEQHANVDDCNQGGGGGGEGNKGARQLRKFAAKTEKPAVGAAATKHSSSEGSPQRQQNREG